MTAPRVRVVSYLVQPHLVLDDGDTLTSLPVQPITVTAADWPGVQDTMAAALAAMQERIAPSATEAG